ncbi:MAG TPA: universal stress protein [Vicinamibacterales bacterium]|jgi:nucleotide-binding universal stress UspA family protein|nr:universal stress protein [Vicinamibacterales bacterium]
MIEIRRILCPIDFSECSRRALDHAVAIARWYKASVTAVHVDAAIEIAGYGPAPMLGVPAIWTIADRSALAADLKRFVNADAASGVTVETVLREGAAAQEILRHATALSADLITMGTHGASGFERLLLGSVTEKVLRKAACPVLTVPPVSSAASAAPVRFKQIVCAVDFSDCSLDALKYALSLAQEADGRLTVVHVLANHLVPDPVLPDHHLSVLAYQRRREDEALQRLDEAVPSTAAARGRVESTIVRGKPWREIVRLATALQSELIVLGVRGRGTAGLMFFGSTANQVVRHAACPVLTLR